MSALGQKQTCAMQLAMSAKGQKRTFDLFNNFVGDLVETQRHFEAKRKPNESDSRRASRIANELDELSCHRSP